MADFDDDDFGELYTDVELHASSAVSSLRVQDQLPHTEGAEWTGRSPRESTQSDKDSETEEELNIVLNDEDYDSAGRNGSGSGDAEIEGTAEMPKIPCGLGLDDDGDYCGKDVSYTAATARVHIPVSLIRARHYFSLPRYRSIFDVNIGSLREKPWRYLGADITDFFNFGLDEASWKIYCNALEQLRQHKPLCSTMAPVSGSSHNKVCPVADHGKSVQEVTANGLLQSPGRQIVSCSTKLTVKELNQLIVKGRAIEVEESAVERHPSMVLRHAPSYDDSDVVIQIPLLDCPEESSSAGKEDVGCLHLDIRDKAGNGEVGANDKEMVLDDPEENAERSELPSPERCSGEANVSKLLGPANHGEQNNFCSDDGADQINQNSERNAEARGRVEEINEGIYGSISTVMENEVCQMERTKLSLSSSLFESDIEASEYSASVDLGKDHATPKRSPLRSCDESQDSIAKDYGDSTITGAGMKPAKWRDYSRNRSMIRRETHQNYALDDDVVSPVSHSRGLPDWENSQGSYSQWNVSRHDFDHYDRECSSYYNSERGSVDERSADNRVHAFSRGSSYRKGHSILRDNPDPYFRRNWKKREISNGENYREDKGERGCDSFRESKWSKGRNSSPPYATQFESNYSSYTSKAVSPSRIDTNDNQLKERYNHAGRFWDHKYEDDFLEDRCGTYFSSRDGERGSFRKSYNRQLPSCREVTSSGRSERHRSSPSVVNGLWGIGPEGRSGTHFYSRDRDRGYFRKSYNRQVPSRREMISSGRNERHRLGPLVADGSWGIEPVDGYGDFLDCEPLSHHPFREPHVAERTLEAPRSSREGLHDARPIRRYGQSPRPRINGGSNFGLSSAYSEVYELGDAIAYPEGGIRLERTRYIKQSKVLHLSNSGLTLTHGDDKFRTEEALLFSRRNSKYAVRHKHDSVNYGMFEDDMQAEQHKYTNLREESGAFHVNRGFHVVDKIQDDQKKPFSRNSVDLYVREGKSSRRAHKRRNMTRDGNPEEDEEELKEAKWVDKFPITEPNYDLDIEEEGQIVADESNPRKPLNKKKRLEPGKATERDKVVSGIDDKRLLEILAKMERRRERFNKAASQVKEPQLQVKIKGTVDKSSLSKNTMVDMVVETAETKLERPARKRRWCGS